MRRIPEKRLFLKSFGYGVYLVRLVPQEYGEHRPQPSNDDRICVLEDVMRRVLASGLPKVQEILPDPDDVETAFVRCGEGLPPSDYERRQTEPEELDRLAAAIQAAESAECAARLEMINAPA